LIEKKWGKKKTVGIWKKDRTKVMDTTINGKAKGKEVRRLDGSKKWGQTRREQGLRAITNEQGAKM